jgi:hypothetical protein
MFMLVTEQLLPGAHSHSGSFIPNSGLLSPKVSIVEFDADVELAESEEGSGRSPRVTTQRSASTSAQSPTTPRINTVDGFKIPTSGLTLTLGLVLHALSDGLALGSSIASDTGSRGLSSVIFAALIIHKGMTVIRFRYTIGISDRNDIQRLLRWPSRRLCWRMGQTGQIAKSFSRYSAPLHLLVLPLPISSCGSSSPQMEARITGQESRCSFLYATILSQFHDDLRLNVLFL